MAPTPSHARATSVAVAAAIAAATILSSARTVEARVNATGAIETFLIFDCAECTKDKNSIFCSEAKGGDTENFVNNGTLTINIRDKKTQPQWNPAANGQPLGPADGAKYCWTGA